MLLNLKKLNLTKIVKERKIASAKAAKKEHDFLNAIWNQLPDNYFSKYQLAQLSNQAKTVSSSQEKHLSL